MRIGAHQSIEGGYTKALERIKNIGGNCLQIFSTSPRGWNFAKIDEVDIIQFVMRKNELRINPIYFHASYLINLADEGRIGTLSKLSLISELNVAPKLQIKGVIIHLGSFKNSKNSNKSKTTSQITLTNLSDHGVLSNQKKFQILIQNIREVLEKTPENALFIIENAGNNKIGKKLEEISTIIEQVDSNRIRLCLDICHLHSAGYDLLSPKKFEDFLSTFNTLIGLEKLEVIHVNDSRDPFNLGRDRHENIGEGSIGLETFRLLLNHPKTKHLPFMIETPGFDQKGPDKKNLDILKSLLK